MQSGCLPVLPGLGTSWFILSKVSKLLCSRRLISEGDGGGAPRPSPGVGAGRAGTGGVGTDAPGSRRSCWHWQAQVWDTTPEETGLP